MQLTIKQTAELLSVPEDLVRRWIRDRGLPAVLCNEQYRLNRVDLMVWAQANQIPVPGELLAHDPAAVSLRQALARGGIHRGVPGSDRIEVVRAAVECIDLPAAVDRAQLLEMIVARQAHGSTAVGHGVAIPHARYPNVAPVTEPILALCFLASGIDFGARDGAPVTALFVLVAPTIRTHLGMLARLAAALSSPFLGLVQAQADDAAIHSAAAGLDAAAISPGKQTIRS